MKRASSRLTLLLALSASLLHAAPPPELTALQQQYAFALTERVTTVFDTSKAALDTKFTAALDNAIATAKSAGDLPTVLAIQGDKKLLAEKQPLPADDAEGTPESLKKLRTIYREQLAKIDETRTTNTAALMTPYVAKLQELEAKLTKSDRVEEAKAVMDYREGLKAGVPAPVPVAMNTPSGASLTPTPAATPAVSTVKGDDRKAAEWLLSIGGTIQLTGSETKISKVSDLPKSKFAISSIIFPAGMAKLEDSAFEVLSGLQELAIVRGISGSQQSDASLQFLSTCPNIHTIDLQSWNGLSGTWLRYLAPLKRLRSLYCVTGARTDVSGLADLNKGSLEVLALRDSATADADLAVIAQFKQLKRLYLRKTHISDAGVAQLAALAGLESLDVSETPVTKEGLKPLAKLHLEQLSFGLNADATRDGAELLGMLFPKVQVFTFGPGTVSRDCVMAVTKSWPKITQLNFPTYTKFEEDAFSGIATSAPGLEMIWLYQTKVTDAHVAELVACKKLREVDLARCDNITDAALTHLQPMKSLKIARLKETRITPDALAAFKKQRPDVEVK